jgi:hypothetical protein
MAGFCCGVAQSGYAHIAGQFPASGPPWPSLRAIIFRLAALFLYGIGDRMPTLLEIIRPLRDVERRAIGRTLINRHVLMHFTRCCGIYNCRVRDVTNLGAGIRLNGLSVIPSVFDISFDNFRTIRACRLIWRDGDFVGAAFDN